MEDYKRIIEVNGIKMEVDLRTAKAIDNYKVGDEVKVLRKRYDDYRSYPGVIVGFDAFEKLPTIIIAYLEVDYSTAKLEFCYYNAQSKDTEICPANSKDLCFDKSRVIEYLDREIIKGEQAVAELLAKKQYFLDNFSKYFNKESE